VIYTNEQLRSIIAPIAASYGVKSLSLFGSYARGEATEDSDVDLLLDRGSGVRGWEIGGLYTDLCEALGKELDLVTVSGADADFLGHIRQDEVVLYEQS
jgi:hypothetical protein